MGKKKEFYRRRCKRCNEIFDTVGKFAKYCEKCKKTTTHIRNATP